MVGIFDPDLGVFGAVVDDDVDEKSAAAAWEEVRKFFAEKLKSKK